jgi:hypothetical protein
MVRGEYAPGNAHYELRPFPHPEQAAEDPTLVPFIEDKGDPNWPAVSSPAVGVLGLADWLHQESFLKSVSVSVRMDGQIGLSVVFPLFVVKHMTDPLTGGWIVNRVYFKDEGFRDFGWGILYTPSASRWLDGYFAVGYESDRNDQGDKRRYWVAESGIKLRADVRHSRMSFMSALTDFWGLRVGLQATGLLPVEDWRYVIEFGAGTF